MVRRATGLVKPRVRRPERTAMIRPLLPVPALLKQAERSWVEDAVAGNQGARVRKKSPRRIMPGGLWSGASGRSSGRRDHEQPRPRPRRDLGLNSVASASASHGARTAVQQHLLPSGPARQTSGRMVIRANVIGAPPAAGPPPSLSGLPWAWTTRSGSDGDHIRVALEALLDRSGCERRRP